MVQKNSGHVIDTDGLSIEVWLDTGHVFLTYGNAQLGDFPLDQPGKAEVEQLANRVAKGEAKVLACLGPDAVIDNNDDFGRNNRTHQGVGTVH